MNNLTAVIWIEARKAWRSKMPEFTAIGFLLVPVACALMMFIYKDPEYARSLGLIGAKANLIGGSADWPFYLNMLAQGTAVGGLMLFSLIASWVFGREFADGTLKDLLAVPVSRSTIILAKFSVYGLWSASMVLLIYLTGLGLGALVGLPQGSTEVLVQGSRVLVVTAGLVIAVVTPVALVASIGRGYLLPLGITMATLALANLLAFMGWGNVFPWSIPALYAGVAGEGNPFEPGGYWIVLLTAVAGIAATDRWWRTADQDR